MQDSLLPVLLFDDAEVGIDIVELLAVTGDPEVAEDELPEVGIDTVEFEAVTGEPEVAEEEEAVTPVLIGRLVYPQGPYG